MQIIWFNYTSCIHLFDPRLVSVVAGNMKTDAGGDDACHSLLSWTLVSWSYTGKLLEN